VENQAFLYLFFTFNILFITHRLLQIYSDCFNRAVKQLIAINRMQNKSLFLYNILYVGALCIVIYMKGSDAKASKCHLKFSSLMMIFVKPVYLSSVISLKWQ